jgi:magnesium transporter
MDDMETLESWERIEALSSAQDRAGLDAYLEELNPGEVARAFSRLDDDTLRTVLVLLSPETAADLIEELSDTQGSDLMESLPVEDAAAIVDEMESHHRADILGEMSEDDAEAILQAMDPEEAKDARKLLEYHESAAGGIMATEFVSYPQQTSVAEVLDDLRANAERYSDYGVQYAYVHCESGTLIGVVRLRDLVLAPATHTLQQIMIPNPLYIQSDAPLEEVAQFFDRYPFYSVPVTDPDLKMVGVIWRADAEEAVGEGHEKSLMRFGGIIGGEELRSMPTGERVSRRIMWLGVNLPLSMIAAFTLPLFEKTILGFPSVLFFIPIIGNICGCSGNQAVAVSIRELTLGLIQPQDFWRVLRKEFVVGLINGAALGLATFAVAVALGYLRGDHAPLVALFIGIAFFVNTINAVCLGGIVPLALRRLKLDPALGAPPILTTLTDLSGFFILLALTTLALRSGLIAVAHP